MPSPHSSTPPQLNPYGGTLCFNGSLANRLDQLFALLQQRSFKRGSFVLASGAISSWYLDCRVTALSGEGSYLIGQLLANALHQLPLGTSVDRVGGMALGACPLITAVTYQRAAGGHPLDGFVVRKEVKTHGAGKQIEGNLQPNSCVVLVEDVVTTGGSTKRAIEVLKANYPSLTIAGVLALVDRQAGGEATFKAMGVPYHYLYSVDAFLQELKTSN